MRVQQAAESLRAQQGHVGIVHQHQIGLPAQGGGRDLHGVGGAKLLRLLHAYGAVADMGADGLALPPDDQHRRRPAELPGGVQGVVDHRLAGHRVQHFGQAGLHARALACGQDNRRERGHSELSSLDAVNREGPGSPRRAQPG